MGALPTVPKRVGELVSTRWGDTSGYCTLSVGRELQGIGTHLEPAGRAEGRAAAVAAADLVDLLRLLLAVQPLHQPRQ